MDAAEIAHPVSAPGWDRAAQAMFRAAQAVARSGGPDPFAELVRELAAILGVATVFVATFTDESRRTLRTLAAVLDGEALRSFDYAVEGSPCAKVVGRSFRHVERGVGAEFPPDTLFAARGMDSYVAFPLADREGMPLGLLVAMDRQPIGDAALAEALLKIFAGRIVAEIERRHVDDALRAAALAVSSARGASVFDELVRLLATILHVEVAFVARERADDPEHLTMLAMTVDGHPVHDLRYAKRGTPCATVVGRQFRIYPSCLRDLFPDDHDAQAQGTESYAGYPLVGQDGATLGVISVASRAPLAHAERIESVLQIFAARAAAEIERLQAVEALRRSEASYRAIFESTEDAIFVHDWASGAILDVNPKACANYGYTVDELRRLSVAELSSGEPPYDAEHALQYLELARLGRCPPFEWHRRNQDGSLHWDEVRLKAAQIDGRPHILAFTREITQHKAALEALRSREEQYRVIFEGSADALVLWDPDIRCVDVNQAFTRLFGWERAEAIGATFPRRFGDEAIRQRAECIRAALQGQERLLETRAVRKDGSRFDVEVRYLPIRYGGVPHVLSIGRDITERKAALAALQASEQQYRAIFDGSADSMGLWSEDLVLVDVNQAFTRLSGWTRDDVIGRRLDERAGEPETARRHELIRGALAGREGRIEARVPSKDGRSYDVEIRYVPVSFGGRAYALSVARDITDRNAALAALRAQEQKYRAIFDGTVDSMVLWNRDLRVVDINDAFVQLTGLRREQVIGRHWSERPDADDLPQLLELIEGALDGRVGSATVNVGRADGSRFEIELRYLPVRFGDEAFALGVGRDVSERLEGERRLRDSEEQYRAIFNASADALVLRDADFRIVDVNATYERMSGFGRDEVLGLDRIVANPAEVAPAIRAQHERALGGEPIEMEVPLLRRDGTRYEIELRGMPIRHRGAPHVLYMGRDVTERRRTERALRDSEEQYREIFNASADALMLWNSRLQRVDVNPAHEKIFGFRRDEVVGRGFEGLPYPEEFARPRLDAVRRALAGEASHAELEAIRKDGRRIVTELRTIPFTQRGEPLVLQIARDITESRSAETRLRASEQQYRAIFDASIDALILWNSRYQRVDVNPAYERIFGWSRDEVIGRGYDQPQFTAAYASPRRELVQRALAGEACSAELDSLRKDGTRIRVDVHVIPFRHLGEPHVLAIVRDITERRAAEEERERLEAQLRQAQKMEAIGQLTGGIAHDFNNILTSVIGYLVLAEERAAGLADERLQRQLGKAQLAAQRARELIAQMLAFARRQRGERRVLALTPLVQQTLQLLRSTLPASVGVDAALPEGPGPSAEVDPVQIEQVLFNLCINARDAIGETGLIRVRLRPAGGAFTCASCRARVDAGAWVAIAVADDGCGIEPQTIERIFEPFFSTKEVGRGSGMGLAMVHGIVHDHGGHVDVQSRPGAGSTFRVLLPAVGTHGDAGRPETPAAGARPQPAALAGRVLVVDDEAMVGDFMAELLGGWGLQVQVERGPQAALDWLADPRHEVELLITDQTMPQLTGLQLAQRAVALRPELPVLLYTGNADA
ncbi:MAG: PAS domain S-box protein, partial [Burkholderiales bacterium]|nr:PAS domain S-box protein [Burkholderiales bacterium]